MRMERPERPEGPDRPVRSVTRLDQDPEAFAAFADSLRGNGYRPATLDLVGTAQRPLFTSSRIRDSATWTIAGPALEKPFRDSLAAWRRKGYQPRAITALEPLFAAILEKDSTPARI